jgi:hypothetical protein
VDKSREMDFIAALKGLVDQVPMYLGGTTKLYILDIDNREIVID